MPVMRLSHLKHRFQTCESETVDEYMRIEETFCLMALELVANWIGRHTR
jgi:hypothetical protein